MVAVPTPLGYAARDDAGIICCLALLAHGHSPLCSYPGWSAAGLNTGSKYLPTEGMHCL